MGNGESTITTEKSYIDDLFSCIIPYKCNQKQQIEQISFLINGIIIILCLILMIFLYKKIIEEKTYIIILAILLIISSSLNMALIGIQPIPKKIESSIQPTTSPT